MNTLEFNFSKDNFNRLFPFYILIDKSLKIKSFGKSLDKICPQIEDSFSFTDCFEISRPHIENPTFNELVFNSSQLTVIKCKKTDMSLRGQFELIDNCLLFVGSPWFQSMHQVVEKKLTLHDFALHDPLLDLLHVLNNQENNTKELKELLTTINNQKNKLKTANKEIHDIALFPMQNPDPLIRIDIEGNLLKRNPAAENLKTFEFEKIQYSPEDFFKHLIPKIDLDKERWIFETKTDGQVFSFVCKTLKEEGYVNIYGRNITEQKKDREELKRLSLVASSNVNAVIFTEIDGTVKWANEGFTKLTGYTLEDTIGNKTQDLFNGPLINKDDFNKIKEAKKAGKHFTQELIHYKKDGTWFWAKAEGQPLFDSKGNIKEYFALIEDISEKKNNEEELKRLSLVASANENGIVFTNPNGKIFWCNDAYQKLTGYSKDEVIGKTPVELGKTENTDLQEMQKMITPFFKGEPFDVELMHGRKDGTSFWTKTKGQPILNSNGEVIQFFAMIEDISLKKRYNESLQIEKEKYRSIIANMNLGLIEVNRNDEITLVNQSFCDISGYSEEELLGVKASNLLLAQESRELVKNKEKIRKKGVTDSYEVKVINKKGQNRHWLISGAPNYDINRKVIGSIGIHLDITEQKDQEEQLYLLSLIAEKNINAVIVTDAEGKMEWANKSFFDMSGFSMEEIIGQKPGHLLQGEETNPETVNYMKDRIDKGLPFNCEIINYSKKGEKYWISVQGQALYNKKGEILKFFAIEENITKKKELEQQREFLVESLAKSNKELEDYAAIVSHDLKSPLRSIHSLISWIKEDNDKQLNQQTTQYLSMIENKVEKMDHLIEGILTYAKIDKVEVTSEEVNTQEIVQNIINIIHIPEHISVTITNTLPKIIADKFRVQQLFQNIISNAVNYIDKPIGTVEVSCAEESKNFIFSIKDNGPGIAKENQEKIFKIFQSLEKSDKSTGLGLSIVKKIIDTYNGEIWIESEVGLGTTFFIKLNK